MQKFVVSLFLIFIVFSSLNAQKIRITRTDVEPIRFGFATATLKFGFDIFIDDIQDAKGVTFTLEHTRPDVILFSGYSNGDFPEKGTIVTNTPFPNRASLSVAALSGNQTTDPGVDTPFAVHLDFVVTPTAQHLDVARFTFTNIRAIVGPDSLVIIPDSIIELAINGFINVYPGDANFDGVVNSLDYAEIAFYTGAGSANSTVRGFKRKNASAIWHPQQALAWDSAAVTDVDCDGSGDVNLSDMLVIATNIEKRHTDRTRRTVLGLVSPTEKPKNTEQSFSTSYATSAFQLPQTENPIIGVLATQNESNIFKNVSMQSQYESYLKNGTTSFFVGRTEEDLHADYRGAILQIDSENELNSLSVQVLFDSGIQQNITLQSITTSSEESMKIMTVRRTNESKFTIKNAPNECTVLVYSILGHQLYSHSYSHNVSNELYVNHHTTIPVIVRVINTATNDVKSFLIP